MAAANRKIAEEIFRAALKAADPYLAVRSHAEKLASEYRRGGYGRLLVAGFGKASTEMARAVHDSLGEAITDGLVITKHGASSGTRAIGKIRVLEAGHPVPDEAGLRAAGELIRLLDGADESTLVVCLVSGGGSALLAAPREGVTLAEKQEITKALLTSGADIHELNAVRKHVSSVKGGRLAGLAWPAKVVSLIVSDVIGDSLDTIASGPTSPDASTYADALDILKKYSITGPENVMRLLKKGAAGEVPETPKPGDRAFGKVENVIVANNMAALKKAGEKAEELGFPAQILTDSLRGDVAEAARFLFEETKRRLERPACLISGGETTVVVKGEGKGGRNMHLALYFAMAIEGKPGITLLSAGTDGTDGPTDAAGAVVDGNTVAGARAAGLTPEEYFADYNSYNFFRQTGDILITGPTGTNVMDIQVMLLA